MRRRTFSAKENAVATSRPARSPATIRHPDRAMHVRPTHLDGCEPVPARLVAFCIRPTEYSEVPRRDLTWDALRSFSRLFAATPTKSSTAHHQARRSGRDGGQRAGIDLDYHDHHRQRDHTTHAPGAHLNFLVEEGAVRRIGRPSSGHGRQPVLPRRCMRITGGRGHRRRDRRNSEPAP